MKIHNREIHEDFASLATLPRKENWNENWSAKGSLGPILGHNFLWFYFEGCNRWIIN